MVAMFDLLNKKDIQTLLDYVNEMIFLFNEDDIEYTKSNNGLNLSKTHFKELKYKLEKMIELLG